MSFAIIRNTKYKRENLKGIYRHNERKNKNYSNDNIDKERSYLIKSRTSVRTKTYDWLLKGIVTCKECGKKLSVVPQKHPNKTTFYLRCNTYACNTRVALMHST